MKIKKILKMIILFPVFLIGIIGIGIGGVLLTSSNWLLKLIGAK